MSQTSKEPGRNDVCPCGSGLKFKQCHGDETIKQKVLRATRLAHVALIADRKIDLVFEADQVKEKTDEKNRVLTIMAEQLEQILPKELIAAVRGGLKEHLVIEKVARCIKCATPLDENNKCPKCN